MIIFGMNFKDGDYPSFGSISSSAQSGKYEYAGRLCINE